MKIRKCIKPLVEDDLVDEVIPAFMSDKKDSVFSVHCGSDIR